MNLILKTKYTSSTEFVLAQVRGNNHWCTSQVRLKILNYRTLQIKNIIFSSWWLSRDYNLRHDSVQFSPVHI
jgi:hypothetical protein